MRGHGQRRKQRHCRFVWTVACACVWLNMFYPRWMVRMCLWMPAAVLSTLPQFFHRHLNITFIEFCRKRNRQQLESDNTQAHKCCHVNRKSNLIKVYQSAATLSNCSVKTSFPNGWSIRHVMSPL